MGAHAHSDNHDHQTDEKAVRRMVIFTLALFFAMTVVGHFVFVASAHHAEESAATETHETH